MKTQYCVQIGFDILPLESGEASKVMKVLQSDKDTIVVLSCGVFKRSAISGIREDVWTKNNAPLGGSFDKYGITKADFTLNISTEVKESGLLSNQALLE